MSKLVKPADETYTAHGTGRYQTRPDSGNYSYDSTRGSVGVDDRYTSSGTNDRQYGSAARAPTADVRIDPIRRSGQGNARTCVMEINIAVSLGGDRPPHASIVSHDASSRSHPPIRSTATIQDVRYLDLNFQGPNNVAHLSTDGIIDRPTSSSQKPTGYYQ